MSVSGNLARHVHSLGDSTMLLHVLEGLYRLNYPAPLTRYNLYHTIDFIDGYILYHTLWSAVASKYSQRVVEMRVATRGSKGLNSLSCILQYFSSLDEIIQGTRLEAAGGGSHSIT
jgi:hypothetical protein